MNKLRLNVLASFLGQGWAALLQLAIIPVYIKLIGIEAYGLIGFYTVLQATVQVFDLGLGQTITREFARRAAFPDNMYDARDLLRTVGLVYWAIAGLISVTILLSAHFLAEYVIKAQNLSSDTIYHAIMVMAVIIPIQWAVNLYQGALMGLERQVLVNVLRTAMVTVGVIGAGLILWLVSSTIIAFLLWQAAIVIANFFITSFFLGRALSPATRRPRFRISIILEVKRFAVGMSGIAVAGIVLTQLDKWILVNLLSLEIFGYYTLAGVIANALYIFITPLFNGLFPRFSILIRQDRKNYLESLYCVGAQVMTAMVIPAAAVLSFYSHEVLLLWTRNPEIAVASAPLVSILVWGTALNGLMNVPYALQLAYGWTGLVLRINVVTIIFLVPSIMYLTLKFGAIGAATAWLIANVIYASLAVPLTNKRLNVKNGINTMMREVLLMACVALVVSMTTKLMYPHAASEIVRALYIVGSYATSVILVALCGSQTRELICKQVKSIRV